MTRQDHAAGSVQIAATETSASTLTVTMSNVRPLLALASEERVSVAGLLKELELPPELPRWPDCRSINLADYFRILGKLAAALHDETCKLSTRSLLPGATTFVLSQLSDCGTLLEAMRRIARAYNHLHGGPYNRIELKDGYLVYAIDDRDFPYSFRNDAAHMQFTMECVLIFLHGMLTLITTDDLAERLGKVNTRRAKGAYGGDSMNFWNAPVRWKSGHYALFYDAAVASIPVTLPDGLPPPSRAIYRKVVELIEQRQQSGTGQPGLVEQVVEAIEQGSLNQRLVARRMCMSVATLRRRLREEHTSFREVRRRSLNATAKSLLKERQHIGDIADSLGFSDFRSFNRAFKNWNGVTPKSYALRHVAYKD